MAGWTNNGLINGTMNLRDWNGGIAPHPPQQPQNKRWLASNERIALEQKERESKNAQRNTKVTEEILRRRDEIGKRARVGVGLLMYLSNNEEQREQWREHFLTIMNDERWHENYLDFMYGLLELLDLSNDVRGIRELFKVFSKGAELDLLLPEQFAKTIAAVHQRTFLSLVEILAEKMGIHFIVNGEDTDPTTFAHELEEVLRTFKIADPIKSILKLDSIFWGACFSCVKMPLQQQLRHDKLVKKNVLRMRAFLRRIDEMDFLVKLGKFERLWVYENIGIGANHVDYFLNEGLAHEWSWDHLGKELELIRNQTGHNPIRPTTYTEIGIQLDAVNAKKFFVCEPEFLTQEEAHAAVSKYIQEEIRNTACFEMNSINITFKAGKNFLVTLKCKSEMAGFATNCLARCNKETCCSAPGCWKTVQHTPQCEYHTSVTNNRIHGTASNNL